MRGRGEGQGWGEVVRRRGAPARASSCMASEVVLYLVGVRLRLRVRDSSRMAPKRGAVPDWGEAQA